MTVFDQHQLAIAKKTLTMTPQMVMILGGMTYEQVVEIVKRHKGKGK